MNRQQLIQDVQRYFDEGRFANDLRRRVAWRTESDTGQVPPTLRTYLTALLSGKSPGKLAQT